MTKREQEQRQRLFNVLMGLGFTPAEAQELRQINGQLHSWYEQECGSDKGCIERDPAGVPFRVWFTQSGARHQYKIADREKGALRRLDRIVKARNERVKAMPGRRPGPELPGDVISYVQTDPRGNQVYIIRPGDVPEGEAVEACYNRGVAVE